MEQLNGLYMDDGALRWISVNARALREGDAITGVVTTFVDVTEQRAMVAALAESEAAAVAAAMRSRRCSTRPRSTRSSAPTPTDRSRSSTAVPSACSAMPASDVVGRHSPMLFHDRRSSRAWAREFGIPVESVLGHGMRRRDTDTRDWTLVRRDGVKPPVSLAITAIRDADGMLTGYLGIGRDITAERQAARELRDAEERFRNAFDQAPIGKALVSPDEPFTRVPTARSAASGYPEEELLGTTFQAPTHPDDLETDLEHVRRMLSGEDESYAMEKRYQHAARPPHLGAA